MIRVRSQTTDRGKKLVFTLAICSSTIQCLMDSTMLCKETVKRFNHKEVTWQLNYWKDNVLSFDLHKWFLLNFQFSEKGRRKQALKSKTLKHKSYKRKSLCKWFSCEVTLTQHNAVWLFFWSFRFPKKISYTTVSNVKGTQGGHNAALISGRKWITQLPVNESLWSFKYEKWLHYFINLHLGNNSWSGWCL